MWLFQTKEMQTRLLLVFLGLAVCTVACPEDCSCHRDKGLYVASCADIPTNAGRVEVLNILPSQRRGNPQELTDGQFNQARHLKYLNLRNNSLYFIHKKAFYGAKGLLEIDLSFNYIEELDPMLFQHLTSLTTLKLRGNPIQLEPELPFVISNSIQHLDIGECKLKSIPRGVFYGIKRLKHLSMDGNHLKSFKYNSLPKGLMYINLSKNLIVNVPSEVLSSLTNLRKINLGRNPINCSCSLMNLQDWLSGRGVIFEESIICALPQEYSGISSSKVDENRLCLVEERRDEISHSAVYSKLFKKKLNSQKHFEHENSYSEENFQADQPQPLHPDTHAEVLFKNEDTISMGEIMRDEEAKEPITNTETPETDSTNSITSSEKDEDFKSENEETENNGKYPNTNPGSNNKLDNNNTSTENINENKAEESYNLETTEPTDSSNKETFENILSDSPSDNATQTVPLTDFGNENKTVNETIEVATSQADDLNVNNTVEYKHLSKEEKVGETDDFKDEEFIVYNEAKYKEHTNGTWDEGTTDTPDVTSEGEISSTDESPIVYTEDNSEPEGTANSTLPFYEATNDTIPENNTNIEVSELIPSPSNIPELLATNDTMPENNTILEVSEVIPSPSNNPDLLATENKTENASVPVGHLGEVDGESTGNPENKSLQDASSLNNPTEQKIKEVHGAEVLMFCLGVLVICLILYSVYKCRMSSNKRPITRAAKDVESNRGTEMQDMASLIPRPPDDDKKNHKYPDKGTSSENVKLITEQNENESPNKKVADDSTPMTKREDKNSLNNNTSSSPTSKTPLLKPEKPLTINPAAPIQRTRVKVGIIPDSIPRTPIFVQKTYSNGTKHV